MAHVARLVDPVTFLMTTNRNVGRRRIPPGTPTSANNDIYPAGIRYGGPSGMKCVESKSLPKTAAAWQNGIDPDANI